MENKVLHLQDWDYGSSLINRHWAPWKVKTIRRRELEYQLQGWDFFSSICKNSPRNENDSERMTGLALAQQEDTGKGLQQTAAPSLYSCGYGLQWLDLSTDVAILHLLLFRQHTMAGIFNWCGNPKFLTF